MSKSNRSLRILVALISIPFLLFMAYWGNWLFLLFTLAVGLLSFYEFAAMSKEKGYTVSTILGLGFVFLFIANAYYAFTDSFLLVLLLPIFFTLSELTKNKPEAIGNIGAGLFGVLYIGLFSSSLIWIREFYHESILYSRGGALIIALFVTIWMCDSAAYFLGTAFGKHKLFPRVSPKKSWEGAVSGFIFSVLAMIVMRELFLEFLTMTDAVIIGALVGIVGQVGDLIESLLKRDAGVKDSSSLIPGHGGIFDRFDSLLFTAPFVYLYLRYFLQ